MGYPVVRFEISGRDGTALRRFYSDLFGWVIDTSAIPFYGIVPREGNTNAAGIGIAGAVSDVPERPSTTWRGATRSDGYPGHVTIYVEVPEVEAALRHAESLGGARMLGPDDVGGGVVIGLFTDPEGRLIGLVGSDASDRAA
ncbi:MAG TPA: VOC family protein [Solirubrobacteraceae bacterium]|nr:VOC family protein [Solirubrobacteraceae bacterium]